jgi:hypothetical protein
MPRGCRAADESMAHTVADRVPQIAPPTGRLIGGIAILAFWPLAKFVGPILVISSNLSAQWKTILSAVFFVGVSNLCLFGAIYVLGKPGFAYLKARFSGLLAPYAPPQEVSSTRYAIGLVMFSLPVVMGWAQPYVEAAIPALASRRDAWGWVADGLLLASFFVLGGDFWDKIKALFSYDMTVETRTSGVTRAPLPRVSRGTLNVATAVFIFGLAAVVVVAGGILAGWLPRVPSLLLFFAEAVILVPIVVTGRQLLDALREKLFGASGRAKPPTRPGRTRYRIGLVMFVLPMLFSLLVPYVGDAIPSYASNELMVNLAADFLLLAALFVLGGEFWDKLRALYLREAIARPIDVRPAAEPRAA